MNQRSSDAAIGALVLGAAAFLFWAIGGYRGLSFAAMLIVTGGVVIRLFESQSKWSKAFAVLMLPALLLTYLRPKQKPSSERQRL